MSKTNFVEVVEKIVLMDTRYDKKAYAFVREGLDYTLRSLKRTPNSSQRHVSGAELVDGLRQHTLKEFGPMSKMVLNEWGICRCEDFGQIVFNLVSHGVLGKSDSDKPEDFEGRFTFEEAFVKPFLPTPPKTKGAIKKRGLKRTAGPARHPAKTASKSATSDPAASQK